MRGKKGDFHTDVVDYTSKKVEEKVEEKAGKSEKANVLELFEKESSKKEPITIYLDSDLIEELNRLGKLVGKSKGGKSAVVNKLLKQSLDM